MRPYLHDLLRTLRGRALVLVVVLTVLGAGLAYATTQMPSTAIEINGAMLEYYDAGAYHLEVFAFDSSGRALSNVGVSVAVLIAPNTSAPHAWVNLSTTTSSLGIAPFLVPIAEGTYGAALSELYPTRGPSLVEWGGLFAQTGFTLSNTSAGRVAGIDPITPVGENDYSIVPRLLVLWEGPGGSPPSLAQVESCDVVDTQFGPPANCSELPTQSLGPLRGTATFLPAPTGPAGTTVLVELVDPVEGVVGTISYGGSSPIAGLSAPPGLPAPSVAAPGADYLTQFSEFDPLLMCFGAFALAYGTYAQPRLSTTLEPVLVRPVSRRGLLLNRYLAAVVLLGSSVVAQLAVLDLAVGGIVGEPIPGPYAVGFGLALFVPALTIAGLVFLVAHVFRSTGPVVTVGIVVTLVFAILWTVLFLLLHEAFGAGGSAPTVVAEFQFGALDPAQVPIYAVGLLAGQGIVGGSGAFDTVQGVTPLLIVLVSVLWVTLPLLGATARATYSD